MTESSTKRYKNISWQRGIGKVVTLKLPSKTVTPYRPRNMNQINALSGLLLSSVFFITLNHNLGVLGSSRTGSSGFFGGSVLGQDTSEASLVLVKPRKDMNNVSCRRDMTEILLKAA